MSLFFLVLFIIGIVIRLLLAFQPGFKGDIDTFFAWSLRLQELGLSNFYAPNVFTDYTPGYLYILAFLGFLKESLQINDSTFYYLLKIPAIIADLLIAIFIFLQTKKYSQKVAILLSTLVLFNPAIIFDSSIWGQVDSVFSLFLCFSIFFLTKQKWIYSSFFFAIALLIKPQSLALAPLFLLLLFTNFSFKKFWQLTLPGFISLIILSLPFYPTNPIFGVINRIFLTADQYQYTSLFAYNLWGIIGFWIDDQTYLGMFNYQQWSLLIYLGFWIYLSYLYIRKKQTNLFLLSALACLAFFFLPTRVHERYLFPALVFLILSYPYFKNKLYLPLLLLISLTFLINLYYVYIYYNYYYYQLDSLLFHQSFYQFLDTQGKIVSLFSTLLFIALSFILITNKNVKKNL